MITLEDVMVCACVFNAIDFLSKRRKTSNGVCACVESEQLNKRTPLHVRFLDTFEWIHLRIEWFEKAKKI